MKSKTSARSLFFDEWQACLRAHYIYVLRVNDTVTEPSLRQVLLHSGLSESDLEALRQEAYAADSSEPEMPPPEPEDVPAVAPPPPVDEPPTAEPGELTYDELGVVVDIGNDEPIPESEEEPEPEPTAEEPDEPPPDFGRQLSMF